VTRILPVLLLLLSMVPAAGASTVRRLGLSDLVSRAELVVEGRCVASETLLDDRGLVLTRTMLQVEPGLRGAAAGELVSWLQPGGELGGQGLVVPGLPALRPGERALLFLTAPTSAGVRVPVGLAQGLHREEQAADGARAFTTDLAGLSLVDETGEPVPTPEATPGVDRDALLGHLTRLVQDDDRRRAREAEGDQADAGAAPADDAAEPHTDAPADDAAEPHTDAPADDAAEPHTDAPADGGSR